MSTIEFSSPVHLHGLNKLLRMHWRERKRYQETLLLTLLSGRRAVPIEGPLRITLERRYCRQPLDPDNCAASAKPVLDVLQRLQIIPSDSPEVVREFLTRQTKVKAKQQLGFTVTIEQIEP